MVQIAYLGSTTGHDEAEHERRAAISNDLVDATVTHLAPETGPISVESQVETAFAATEICKLVAAHEHEVDAFLVGCFGEPGLEAARELTDKPVVGSASAAFHVAAQLADRVSCVTVLDAVVPLVRERVRACGLHDVVTDVRVVDAPIEEIGHDDSLVDDMVDAGRRAVEEAGAEALVPGCMSLSYMRANEEVAERVGVPVVDPVAAGLETAELLATQGFSSSAVTYQSPNREKIAHLLE
ncbi:aspartate/glutamate racemase family protein [Halobacteria archaeon AArc-curdl1]|uniref:Aspartate/glutamate racemase family protein n=1 Tax=Natronosalvus hydrolyticus TaxID=2979988 RepID=A0AAP2Z671_9EURY|nr:aspartate/glutamate racemase family protein [Halobacteria archaeon AArc-curdl1]